MIQELPVTVIGGYLGAGKTTLVNQLLRRADGQKLAILVNEFGDLAIDEDLIETSDDEMISIAGGCICCSFGSDLTAALIQLSELNPRPDHVVIEASGVAMPGAIGGSIMILDGFALAGIVVLADGLHLAKLARDEYLGDTILRQLSDADVIVLTKTDLMNSSDQETLSAWIADQNPTAQLVPASFGKVPNVVVLGIRTDRDISDPARHADLDYDSIVLDTGTVTDADELAKRLCAKEMGIIRAKGYVQKLDGQTKLIQIVGAKIDISLNAAQTDPKLVCIGLKGSLDKQAIGGMLKELTAPA